jgi:hypothetical protein
MDIQKFSGDPLPMETAEAGTILEGHIHQIHTQKPTHNTQSKPSLHLIHRPSW